MSGHNKWAQIKHKKGATDAKKAQVFSKISKLISLVAKAGTDPVSNMSLQTAIERAKSINMPKESIERAIRRASDKSELALHEVTIKALTLHGIGITITAITDNTNRTIAEIKNILASHSSKMVQWIPNYPMETDRPTREAVQRLVEELESNEDVEKVTNTLVIRAVQL